METVSCLPCIHLYVYDDVTTINIICTLIYNDNTKQLLYLYKKLQIKINNNSNYNIAELMFLS